MNPDEPLPPVSLSEVDRDLLELAVLKVPWYMVCGDFHGRYGSPGALAQRLFALRDAGLLNIWPRSPDELELNPEALEQDALANNCYDDFDSSRESRWEIVATDTGFAAVEDDLREQ